MDFVEKIVDVTRLELFILQSVRVALAARAEGEQLLKLFYSIHHREMGHYFIDINIKTHFPGA